MFLEINLWNIIETNSVKNPISNIYNRYNWDTTIKTITVAPLKIIYKYKRIEYNIKYIEIHHLLFKYNENSQSSYIREC